MTPSIGIFGGSFNPVHHGHLRSALDICQDLNLTKIIFMPTFVSPHKSGKQLINNDSVQRNNEHRFNMLKLAISDCVKFEVSDYEMTRKDISFTINTIEHFRNKHPNSPLFFLMGLDSLLSFTRWHRWQDILSHCHLVVSHRPGYDISDEQTTQLLNTYQTTSMQDLHSSLGGAIYLHQAHPLQISSSNIRELTNKAQAISYLTPPAVENYIKKHQLYLS